MGRVFKTIVCGAAGLLALANCGSDGASPPGTSMPSPVVATPVPVPVPVGAHGYFESLAARPDRAYAYSLRDQAELDQHVHGPFPSSAITYDPANDSYRLAQDAAKVLIGPNESTIEQVRLPIDSGAGKALVTWDAWWGQEFRTDRGGMSTQKTFQIGSPRDNSQRYLEIRTRFTLATGSNICATDMRAYAKLGPNVTDDAPVSPQRGEFQIAPNTWTRFWVEVDIIEEGFDRVSMWVADERRDAVQLLDRRELESAGSLTNFWFEYNGSEARTGGPLVGYVRNLVVLRNVSNPSALFQRPGR